MKNKTNEKHTELLCEYPDKLVSFEMLVYKLVLLKSPLGGGLEVYTIYLADVSCLAHVTE